MTALANPKTEPPASRTVVNSRISIVKVFPAGADLPKLPVARVVWQPMPNLQTGAAAWILADGAHHTGFSMAVTPEHLEDFAEMAGVEYVLIDEETRLSRFKQELRWNDLYYHFSGKF